MVESKELKKIKKVYGENFMKLCRSLFPTLLEKEGLLYEILTSLFSGNSKTLYEDIVNSHLEEVFKNYVYDKVDVENLKKNIIVEKTPYELLDTAGYDLIECHNEKEIQKFRKYYAPTEELCTFKGGRLDRCVVFFAVKKDVDNIKRKNFTNPKREDEYGTSVMSIQFNKEGICTVSIKNRYNHRVNNPDATYGNDLDRITPGLTQSFANLLKERGLELNSSNIESFEIPGYTMANDGKYYKFNMEIDGTYYCPGNIIIQNGEAKKLENPEKNLLIDYFILDLKNKTIELYNKNFHDSFTDGLQDLEKIEIQKDKEKGNGVKTIRIQKKNQESPIIIEIDKDNKIIGYKNNELTQTGFNFLFYNYSLTNLELPNLSQAGPCFLYNNQVLTNLQLPKLMQAGLAFLFNNRNLTNLHLPRLIRTGNDFLACNEYLSNLYVPKLTQTGNNFLLGNKRLTNLHLPRLIRTGNDFLEYNENLSNLYVPKLTQTGNNFLAYNENLSNLSLPKLTQTGDNFLFCNKALTSLVVPNLSTVGDNFLHNNGSLTHLELPNSSKLRKLKKSLLRIVNKNLEVQKTKSSEPIHAGNIAKLDKDNKITQSEVTFAGKIIKKLQVLFKNRENNQK